MLKQEVVDAISENKFSIYPIDRMEEGLEILTGKASGMMAEDKTYPENTINYLVMKRLTEMSKALDDRKEKEDLRIGPSPSEVSKE